MTAPVLLAVTGTVVVHALVLLCALMAGFCGVRMGHTSVAMLMRSGSFKNQAKTRTMPNIKAMTFQFICVSPRVFDHLFPAQANVLHDVGIAGTESPND